MADLRLTTGLVLFLLAFALGRVVTNRALVTLTAEEKARLLDVFAQRRVYGVILMAGPWPDPIPTFTMSCPNGAITPQVLAATTIFNTGPSKRELAPDGKSFGGQWETRLPSGVVFEWRYAFRCIGC